MVSRFTRLQQGANSLIIIITMYNFKFQLYHLLLFCIPSLVILVRLVFVYYFILQVVYASNTFGKASLHIFSMCYSVCFFIKQGAHTALPYLKIMMDCLWRPIFFEFVCVSVCVSVCLSVCLSVYPVYLCATMYTSACACTYVPHVYLYVSLHAYISSSMSTGV